MRRVAVFRLALSLRFPHDHEAILIVPLASAAILIPSPSHYKYVSILFPSSSGQFYAYFLTVHLVHQLYVETFDVPAPETEPIAF